jgi:hypothetical protein
MSKAAKTADTGREPFHRLSDSEILLFVTRTLQPHCPDADAPDLFAKLQKLKDLLDRQENTLLDCPHSSSTDRLHDGLANAKTLLAQIFDDLASAAGTSAARDAKTA